MVVRFVSTLDGEPEPHRTDRLRRRSSLDVPAGHRRELILVSGRGDVEDVVDPSRAELRQSDLREAYVPSVVRVTGPDHVGVG